MAAEKDNLPRASSDKPSQVLVHYDEITLKGRNRRHFEKALHQSIKKVLSGVNQRRVVRTQGRIVIELGDEADVDLCLKRLGQVLGVTRYMPVTRVPASFDEIESWIGERLDALPRDAHSSFAIQCKRANKQLPFSSQDVHLRVGDFVRKRTGWSVNLDKPDLEIFVRLVHKDAYIGFERYAGPGGLPLGSTGRVVSLLSGGIDSPVASHHILRRGARPTFVHFHSFPHTSSASQDKVRELGSKVLPFGHHARLYMVPFADLQQKIIMNCPPALRVILYRRFMMRAAEAIAKERQALAIVTGDSLGQVASQTLHNLETINSVVTLPVLRPLIGLHKAHIVEDARTIGTYETSIEPHDDCCSYLMPQNPATKSRPWELDRAEESLDVEAEVKLLIESSSLEHLIGED